MCGLCPSVEWQCCNFEGTECNAEYIVTSDAACWKAILISLCSNEFSNIPPKLRSHDAAHTTVRSHFYKKIGFALLYHLHPTIMSKLHSGMNTAHIDKIYSFLVKNIRFTCICAFFVVTLHVFFAKQKENDQT